MPTEPTAATTPTGWTPRWYLWDGGFLVLGASVGEVPLHEHHAIQVTLAIDRDVAIRDETGPWREGRGVIVQADVVHGFDGRGATGAMVFVEPESFEGQWLRASLTEPITLVPDARLTSCTDQLRAFYERPLDGMDIGPLIRYCVRTLSAGAPPARRLDPRVTRVLGGIRASDDLRVSLETAASVACLSPSRFAHLFKEQVGLPFRRYMLWRKLTRAMLAIGRQGTVAAAAHAADFADAAHLTRTFHQMFGLPPSVLMRGDFFEIPPPFELSPAA